MFSTLSKKKLSLLLHLICGLQGFQFGMVQNFVVGKGSKNGSGFFDNGHGTVHYKNTLNLLYDKNALLSKLKAIADSNLNGSQMMNLFL